MNDRGEDPPSLLMRGGLLDEWGSKIAGENSDRPGEFVGLRSGWCGAEVRASGISVGERKRRSSMSKVTWSDRRLVTV